MIYIIPKAFNWVLLQNTSEPKKMATCIFTLKDALKNAQKRLKKLRTLRTQCCYYRDENSQKRAFFVPVHKML